MEFGVVVPFPSWPWALCPQHFAPPPAVTAHVWNPPVEIWAAVSPEAGGTATTEKRREAAPNTNALATCLGRDRKPSLRQIESRPDPIVCPSPLTERRRRARIRRSRTRSRDTGEPRGRRERTPDARTPCKGLDPDQGGEAKPAERGTSAYTPERRASGGREHRPNVYRFEAKRLLTSEAGLFGWPSLSPS